MNKKPIIINAFHGLGDILFCIPLYRNLIEQGHKVIHPYLETYGQIWKHFPEITWVPKSLLGINYHTRTVVETDNYKILPLRWQEKPGAVMRSKYDFMEMDFMEWRKLTWVRNREAEDNLFDSLGLNDGAPYILVNETFQHDERGKMRIKTDPGIRRIDIRHIPGFTLLDWGKVIESASEIHTVSTSLNYILDCDFLNINCPMHIYPRHPKEGFSAIDYLMKKNYTWHE